MTLELSNNIFTVNGATVDVRKDTLDETLPDRSKKWRCIQSLLDKLRIVGKERYPADIKILLIMCIFPE